MAVSFVAVMLQGEGVHKKKSGEIGQHGKKYTDPAKPVFVYHCCILKGKGVHNKVGGFGQHGKIQILGNTRLCVTTPQSLKGGHN